MDFFFGCFLIILLESGRVYSWGENRNAKLGHHNYPHTEEGFISNDSFIFLTCNFCFKLNY